MTDAIVWPPALARGKGELSSVQVLPQQIELRQFELSGESREPQPPKKEHNDAALKLAPFADRPRIESGEPKVTAEESLASARDCLAEIRSPGPRLPPALSASQSERHDKSHTRYR